MLMPRTVAHSLSAFRRRRSCLRYKREASKKMCKFTNRLFVLFFLQFIGLAMAKPSKMRSSASDLLELLYNDYGDYGYQQEEIHYDQRQKGEENLKLRLDGFVIGMPSQDDSSWLDILADEYLTNPFSKKTAAADGENSVADTMTAQVVNIPAPKKDIESRQHANDETANPPRTKTHMLQLLQMLRRTQP
ncbi:uncharacterized protein LOC133835036 [Drosophila sulfurigaster albostrigata]|uniref:uncharacterized protein LOC133835036 n=1 Tax=Drosophila sulfurigaster albostrigata TaxID=89887 RepID=UPI002D21B16D|nr:uncharacterized protein LOC133835036 [Drosophila sulfurigaster albostrigata]